MQMDMGMFLAALVMLGFGIVMVYSSSFAIAEVKWGGRADALLIRQVVRVLVALVFFAITINVDYHLWTRLGKAGYGLALLMLLAVLVLPGSRELNGARRWISLGPVTFQVSEFARMALIVFLARRCEELGDSITEWNNLWKLLLVICAVCGLVVVEPDFSTTMIIAVAGMTVLFAGGARFAHLGGIVAAGIPVAAIGLLSAPYRRARLLSYFNLSGKVEAVGYQTQQALIGLGNGGLFGVGLGQGRQKYFYLPEPHTDFAFAMLGEEVGFVGLVVVIALFTFMVWRGLSIAMNAPDKSGRLMAFGFTFVLAAYVLIHTGVNVGLIPTTGVPLPLLSYGGMNVVFTMCSIGILLNISSQAQRTTVTTVKARSERLRKFRP